MRCVGWLLGTLLIAVAGQAFAGSILVAYHRGKVDPVTEGWTFTGTSPYIRVGPVPNDPPTGVDAWYVYDSGTRLGDLGAYLVNVSSSLITLGNLYGWRYVVDLKVLSGSGSPGGSPMVLYRDGTTRWQLHFGTTTTGNLLVRLVTSYYGAGPVYTIPGGADRYNRFEMVYDPVSRSASVYVNGSLLASGYRGFSWTDTIFYWGAGSSRDTGRAHFSNVEFYVNPEPASVVMWGAAAAAAYVWARRRRHRRDETTEQSSS